MISVVLPLFNECNNPVMLFARLKRVLEDNNFDYEIIFVNDGSTDQSLDVLQKIKTEKMKIVSFEKRRGQSAAIAAGFHHARGDIIVTMDADLQNDPHDIPRLLNKLNEGYDLVNGWRINRKDHLLTKIIPSLIANRIIALIFRLKVHDIGCSFKAYRREVAKKIVLHDRMHRYIPLWADSLGFKVAELEVNHLPRINGVSKYGLERIPYVIVDIINIFFIRARSKKAQRVGKIRL
jgi:glycosyltransferase involved in cell wall biosynthesis